jgi:hypothetical protein
MFSSTNPCYSREDRFSPRSRRTVVFLAAIDVGPPPSASSSCLVPLCLALLLLFSRQPAILTLQGPPLHCPELSFFSFFFDLERTINVSALNREKTLEYFYLKVETRLR